MFPHFTASWKKRQIVVRPPGCVYSTADREKRQVAMIFYTSRRACISCSVILLKREGGGIMSSYLFCTKLKYLSAVNTYQEQTIGRGASSSQTHIWLPPPQRPNHVLRVFSDSGKSASFESTFQSLRRTEGPSWNWRETCVHTQQLYCHRLDFSPCLMHNFMLLYFSIQARTYDVSIMKHSAECVWFMSLWSGRFPLKR